MEGCLTCVTFSADWCRTRGHTGFDEPASFSRYLKGLATGDWSGAEHERALSEGTLTAGGHLVPTCRRHPGPLAGVPAYLAEGR